jgi:hypothetical protein
MEGGEAEAEHGRLGEGAELKAWGVVGRSGRLGEGRTEGLGCGRAKWKARGRGRSGRQHTVRQRGTLGVRRGGETKWS